MKENDDARIERVARALCEAEGRNPEQKRQTNEFVATRLPSGAFQQTLKQIFEWERYRDEAMKFIAAFDAAAQP